VTTSTGPRTPGGKMIVSRNALRHGLLSQNVITDRENIDDWEEFRAAIVASLLPEAPVEHALADRAAMLLWRLRRVAPAEAEAIRHGSEDEQFLEDQRLRNSFGQHPRPLPYPGLIPPPAIDRVVRYEAHLNKQLITTLHELEAMQGRRQGNPSPLARLDIAGEAPP